MSEELKELKDEIKQLNYFLTQLIVEMKQLNDNLQNLGFLQANKQLIQKEQKQEKREEGFKGDVADLQRYLKQMCPTVWANLSDIKRFKSGDFLITFDYVDSNTYQKMAEELKEKLGAYYSKKYRGFIVPGAQGGK